MAANQELETTREFLSQAIVEVITSWPERDRRIFIQIHYEGKSAEEVSNSSGLRLTDILQILRVCEWRLSKSLQALHTPWPETARRPSDVSAMRASN
jgi:DNA-directed RNA polymerase specialized sigma24 family protein